MTVTYITDVRKLGVWPCSGSKRHLQHPAYGVCAQIDTDMSLKADALPYVEKLSSFCCFVGLHNLSFCVAPKRDFYLFIEFVKWLYLNFHFFIVKPFVLSFFTWLWSSKTLLIFFHWFHLPYIDSVLSFINIQIFFFFFPDSWLLHKGQDKGFHCWPSDNASSYVSSHLYC